MRQVHRLSSVVWLSAFLGLAGPAGAQDPDYILDVGDGAGVVGASVSIGVTLTSFGDDIAGWEFDVCDDTLVEVGFGDVLLGADTESLDFSSHSVSYEVDAWSISAILDASNRLLAGDALELYLVDYALLEEGLSEPYFCGAFVPPLVTTFGSEEIEPETGSGAISITLTPPGEAFLRGDVNGNGLVEPLRDADLLMRYLFVGTSAPPCLDAADSDNNGTVNIADAIILLSWGFFGGAPPADPGPTTCGVDPEGGDIGCGTPPDPCPGTPLVLDPDSTLSLTLSTPIDSVPVEESVALSVTLGIASDPIHGYQFGVCHGDGLALADLGGASPIAPGDELPTDDLFFEATATLAEGWIAAGYLNPISGAVIEAAESELYVATYRFG